MKRDEWDVDGLSGIVEDKFHVEGISGMQKGKLAYGGDEWQARSMSGIWAGRMACKKLESMWEDVT